MIEGEHGAVCGGMRGNMTKKISIFLAAALLTVSLAGCGENQIPDMTDEQMQMLGEFTAITLMKYDANRRSRLVDLSLLEQTKTPQTEDGTEDASKPQGMDPVDDVPVEDASSKPQEPASIGQALGLPDGLEVLFMGQEICESYPEDESGFFAVNAAEGKKLLVLDFAVVNALEQDQAIDLLTASPVFRVTVNGEYTRRALNTMLENDMSTYFGTVAAMGSVSLALVIEVEEGMAGELQSLILEIKNGSADTVIPLI